MKRKLKTKRSHNKLAKNSIQACLFPSCAPPKKGNRKSLFFLPQMCKTKKNVRNRTKQFMSTFFLSNKKKESTCCKTVGGKFQTIFKATAKILHHRLPHKVRQSGGFYFSFFFFAAPNRWFSDGFFSPLVAEVARKLPNHEATPSLLPIPEKRSPSSANVYIFWGRVIEKYSMELLPGGQVTNNHDTGRFSSETCFNLLYFYRYRSRS